MSNLLITPILFQYNFLDELCSEAATILSLESEDKDKYQQFKVSIFLNFNRYLTYSLLFLPENKAEEILAKLTPVMESANEKQTLEILNNQIDFFPEVRSEFLNIIKNIKK